MTVSLEEIAREAAMGLRFHEDSDAHVRFCHEGNVNVILTAIRAALATAQEELRMRFEKDSIGYEEHLTALWKDKERLDWIESQGANGCLLELGCDKFTRKWAIGLNDEIHNTVREAIDAALATKE